MNIAISTVKRPNGSPYLDRLIKCLRQDYDGDLHLIIGGKDTIYTDKYVNGYIKHFIGKSEDEYPTNIQKAGLGYYTALTLNRNEPLLVFEDDAVLKPGWYEDLQNRITFIPDKVFALSLITPTGALIPEPDSTVPSVQRYGYQAMLEYKTLGQLPVSHIITYSNTTGVYYPTAMLQTKYPEFIHKFAVEGDAVYDIVLGQFMFRYDLPMYITVPNLLVDTDIMDSHLGHIKPQATVDYSDWDYTSYALR